jgi:hypothetical protein
MSKTIDLQIEKSRMLIDGYRKNLDKLNEKGVSSTELDCMDADLVKLAEAGKECEEIRAKLSEKVKKTNDILNVVKASFAKQKKIVRDNYPQEVWASFGVTDKR